MEKNFVHLHLHSEYSLLDGVGKIDEYIDRAKKLKMKAISITDHGNMFGALEFYKKAIKAGIKPIIGTEAYISEFEMEKREGRNFHLILLAKNEIGYKNLLKISSEGYLNGFYYKPRVDKKFLKEHSEGIIALSACMQGEISRRFLDRESEEVLEETIKSYIDIYGEEDFYIEVQGNGIDEQKFVNRKLLDLSKKFNLKTVATNDTHYVYEGDHELQDILLCIQTGSKITENKRMKIETKELFLKSRKEMINSLGEEFIEAVDRTEEIADKCNLEIDFGTFKFPHYEVPTCVKNIDEFLRKLVYRGLKNRYPKGYSEEIIERVDYELDVIKNMGYSGYFVVVWDFIDYAKRNNIPIGPGRGSAAGSLVAYALKITELDPLEYHLIFERFLNPERISMPDIDIDICQERRGELIHYVNEKYGEDKVAQIITFGTMKARAAIRDVGRVLDIPLSKIDKLAKLIPGNYTLEMALRDIEEVKNLYNEDEEIQRVLNFSKRLENKVRHASIHAAGVVITKEPLNNLVPLYSDNKDKSVSTQYQMKELEELGLLKMDFLGLRNLTNLQRTIDYIKENLHKEIKLEDISLNKKEIYEMLSKGDSLGVFQLESSGIRKILRKLKPEKFQDLIALLALYRPGPLGSGMVDNFINGKNGQGEIVYPHPSLEEVLKETYGVILYQEQVMKIANIMASYSLGEADLLRRAMGKKDIHIMEENREKFVSRAIKNGYTEEISREIFDLIDKFAGYGFNKSHSAAYALIAYWTGYFKYFYPEFYYAAILTSERNNIDNIAFYVEDCKNHGIRLELPSINKPFDKFTVVNGKIQFSLAAIKNVGESLAKGLQEEILENGEFKSYEDFVYRGKKFGLNKKSIEALIFSGALDELYGNRKQKYESLEKVIDYGNKRSKEDEIQQMNLFGEAKSEMIYFSLPAMGEYSLEEKLEKEKEFLGFYYSAHPLDKYKDLIKVYNLGNIGDIKDENGMQIIKTYGILRELKKVITKRSGEEMGLFYLEDFTSGINGIIFPREFKIYNHNFIEGKPVYVEGNIQSDYFNGVETKKIVIKHMEFLEGLEGNKRNKVYILLKEEEKHKFVKLKEILSNYPGNVPLYFALKTKDTKEVKQSQYRISVSRDFIEDVTSLLGKNSITVK
ncbi:DNA polymerase-3 subunit alpha [Cetobacterium ceti]|uniref:DNA-directed DNA polymerase n=1 Tax=Cetobacterium ceti TaxID=180163 RepID=A0A1T4L212_9FUSO|nr:DNA polymerase III subunit alpha [Cetobacterium ceti]SJZ48621.1 DNA polymerase-3 subunit alpha [Cetobacterium ceti]